MKAYRDLEPPQRRFLKGKVYRARERSHEHRDEWSALLALMVWAEESTAPVCGECDGSGYGHQLYDVCGQCRGSGRAN